ncbi:MAG: acyl carrier protein [Magnetococcales bacterium]|nr:acyl carrier protein [Magnetococcales bacterium]
MSPETILDRLRPIFHETFQDSSIVVTESLSMGDLAAWDSIGHMSLIMAVEKAFGFQCSLEELVDLDDVRDLIGLVERKLAVS